jgi:hypothetical protein
MLRLVIIVLVIVVALPLEAPAWRRADARRVKALLILCCVGAWPNDLPPLRGASPLSCPPGATPLR